MQRLKNTTKSNASMENKNINWDATTFFRGLTEKNRLAESKKFRFCEVSGLDGFVDAVKNAQQTTAFICVSDVSDGWTDINNTPHTRRVKTVFLAMRHKVDDMTARAACMETMREIFRQFMSKFIQEKTRLEQNFIYPDSRIRFTEMPRYFFTGCAGAYFQIALNTYTDLQYNGDEWID